MSYFDLFALVGLGLEIWGFIWILKYNRIQRASDLEKWALRNGYSENMWNEIPRERDMILDNDVEISGEMNIRGERWSVPNDFYNYSESRRKWGIGLVVIGLGGQIIQVLSMI